ncbi:MAG: MgtC/SapB family protein [Sporocytophaga sp.]|uniref:MgtC/SapB family protein n=1 Tax=Sporocytophaga sp. TaxID=2231183 RepID=UPI001B1E1C49|nr:MgtC/SapB family protein [Sporocytophaga sp.]MBO9702041.1 MgtC/SapB family protein [Sporocytophaga sp.]
MKFIEGPIEYIDFSIKTFGHSTILIVIAIVLGIPIGWERGKGINSTGLRTFPIVSMASCGFVILAKGVSLSNGDPSILGSTMQGMLSGLGFIGGGMIIKEKGDVQGIVTAASIWNVAAIGMCVGFGRPEISLVLCIVNFLTLFLLTPISKKGLLDPEGGLFKEAKPKGKFSDADDEAI